MPSKIEFNCTTGEQDEVEMTGSELKAHEALLAVPDPETALVGVDVGAAIDRTRADLGTLQITPATMGELDRVFGRLKDNLSASPAPVSDSKGNGKEKGK